MRSLVFWTCLPLIVPQAIRVRRTAPRFDRASGPNRGSVGDGPNIKLVAIGDSIIAGVGAKTLSNALVGQTARELSETLKCSVSWAARGMSGANSGKVIQRLLPRLPDYQADAIVVSVGVNDVTSLTGVATWKRNLHELLGKLAQHSPDAIIAFAGIPPLRGFPLLPQPMRALFGLRGDTLDDAAREVIANYPTAVHVPLDFEPRPEYFCADGYHPSEDSYRVFGKITAQKIAEQLNVPDVMETTLD